MDRASLGALLTSCVTLNRSVKLSRPQCTHQRVRLPVASGTWQCGMVEGCAGGKRQESLLTCSTSDHQQYLGQRGCPFDRLAAGLQGSSCPVN